MRPDVERPHQDNGRGKIRTERPCDDAGVRQHRIAQRRKSLCQHVFELGHDLGAGASPTHLHSELDALAHVVPDVSVVRHLDPRVQVSRESGLDADHVRQLVVHRPPGALGGLRQVVHPAAAPEVDHSLGGLGEGIDEVMQSLRHCRV